MPKSYFDDMYDNTPDPWGFDSSWYEARKYHLTVASLPRQRYRCGFEPGCANGALTELLAVRCDELYACDFVGDAVERAKDRLADLDNVDVSVAQFPEGWPPGTGDLVVWSEMAYYLDAAGRTVAEKRLSEWLEPGGTLIAVHYTGATNYPMSGHEVGRWIDTFPCVARTATLTDEQFELIVWNKKPSTDASLADRPAP